MRGVQVGVRVRSRRGKGFEKTQMWAMEERVSRELMQWRLILRDLSGGKVY